MWQMYRPGGGVAALARPPRAGKARVAFYAKMTTMLAVIILGLVSSALLNKTIQVTGGWQTARLLRRMWSNSQTLLLIFAGLTYFLIPLAYTWIARKMGHAAAHRRIVPIATAGIFLSTVVTLLSGLAAALFGLFLMGAASGTTEENLAQSWQDALVSGNVRPLCDVQMYYFCSGYNAANGCDSDSPHTPSSGCPDCKKDPRKYWRGDIDDDYYDYDSPSSSRSFDRHNREDRDTQREYERRDADRERERQDTRSEDFESVWARERNATRDGIPPPPPLEIEPAEGDSQDTKQDSNTSRPANSWRDRETRDNRDTRDGREMTEDRGRPQGSLRDCSTKLKEPLDKTKTKGTLTSILLLIGGGLIALVAFLLLIWEFVTFRTRPTQNQNPPPTVAPPAIVTTNDDVSPPVIGLPVGTADPNGFSAEVCQAEQPTSCTREPQTSEPQNGNPKD
eukprot:TRINITY_DN67533_c3_g4_i3.p1 TRINITY_DN67533_c3_g4~~TRINITY_DN67533_c3_g4_i3.p1  ORF type:complete len:451 (-),score=34.87 TRINITY_DN67533_c3_g4_i3:483-1835(-)